jgi:plasmid stabilization system protein ParE
MKIRYSPRARSDLVEILAYLDERSPQGARNVKRAISRAITLIGRHPKIGRLSGVQETRVLPAGRYPYLIYWSIEAGEAWLIHIRHARRRPWADELSDQSDR